jgi:hypothetical protein
VLVFRNAMGLRRFHHSELLHFVHSVAIALQALKQSLSRSLALRAAEPFWQARYFDFNVWSEEKRIEKLR